MEKMLNSVITIGIILNNAKEIEQISELQKYLHNILEYYEILIIINPNIIDANDENILAKIPNARCLIMQMEQNRNNIYSIIFENSIGDFVILYSLDEHNFDIIGNILNNINSEHDIINVYYKKNDSLYSKLNKYFINIFNKLTNSKLHHNSSYTACYSRAAVNAINEEENKGLWVKLFTGSSGYKETSITGNTRKKRNLKYICSHLSLIIESIGAKPVRMLYIISSLALFCFISNVIFILYVFFLWLISWNIQAGWTTTTLLLSFMFSILFLSLFIFSSIMINSYKRKNYNGNIAREITRTDFISSFSNINVLHDKKLT